MTENTELQGRLVDLGEATGHLRGHNPSPQGFGFNASNDGRKFSSGAQRDSAHNKPRPDLLSPFATMRKARVMALGAAKYGERNWEKGMPLSVFLASANRHLLQFMMGMTDEDHAAHCAFNLDAIMHGQEMIARGVWPAEYNDLPSYDAVVPAQKEPKCEQLENPGLLEPAPQVLVDEGPGHRQGGGVRKSTNCEECGVQGVGGRKTESVDD